MNVTLVFPPQWCPTQPYLSLPSLSAYLIENGQSVQQRDLNVESYNAFLTPEYLNKIRKRVLKRFSELDSQELLFHHQKKEYCAQFQAALIGPYIASQIDESKAVFRDTRRFFNFETYADAQRILQRGLRMVSAAYYPSELTLSSFDMGSSLWSMNDVLAATENDRVNPYLSLFAERFLPEIAADPPNLLGISIVGVSQMVPGLTFARLVKTACPETHIVIGGSIFTHLAARIKQWPEAFGRLFDSVIVYEGEIPLLELCRCLASGRTLESVPNLIYQENGSIKINSHCVQKTMDSLPTPVFNGLPLERYFSPFLILPILSSRGCYWRRCAFCSHSQVYGNRYSTRSPERLAKDLRSLSSKHATKYFTFNDEGVAPSRLSEIAHAIASEGLELRCNADARLEKRLLAEHFRIAFNAGFRAIYFGLESGCDRVLGHMSKGTNCENAETVFRRSSEAGIWNHAFLFFGFPTETEDEARETIEFVCSNKRTIHSVGHTTFLMTIRSPIMENPEKFGVTNICDDKSSVLGFWKVYSVEKGLTQEQAQGISKEFSKRLQKEYRDWHVWGTIPREHLLLYLARYETRELGRLFPGRECTEEEKSKASIPLEETVMPKLKPEVFCGIARFDVAEILMDNEEEGNDLAPRSLAVLWDVETGKTVSVTPSAAAILACCDGQRQLGMIAREIAVHYGMSPDIILTGCKGIVESVLAVGFCTLERG